MYYVQMYNGHLRYFKNSMSMSHYHKQIFSQKTHVRPHKESEEQSSHDSLTFSLIYIFKCTSMYIQISLAYNIIYIYLLYVYIYINLNKNNAERI